MCTRLANPSNTWFLDVSILSVSSLNTSNHQEHRHKHTPHHLQEISSSSGLWYVLHLIHNCIQSFILAEAGNLFVFWLEEQGAEVSWWWCCCCLTCLMKNIAWVEKQVPATGPWAHPPPLAHAYYSPPLASPIIPMLFTLGHWIMNLIIKEVPCGLFYNVLVKVF